MNTSSDMVVFAQSDKREYLKGLSTAKYIGNVATSVEYNNIPWTGSNSNMDITVKTSKKKMVVSITGAGERSKGTIKDVVVSGATVKNEVKEHFNSPSTWFYSAEISDISESFTVTLKFGYSTVVYVAMSFVG